MSQPNRIRVLVACEMSGRVREAFHNHGFNAWSCDILPTEIEGQHIQGNVLDILNDSWDLMIAHPPCTYLSYVGALHWDKPSRANKREEAMKFFMQLVNAPIKHICIENPLGLPNQAYRRPDQVINPYYFGEPFRKRTCLWLKHLPLLTWYDTYIKPPPPYYIDKNGEAKHWVDAKVRSSIDRSRTFQGIADAMALQWGNYLRSIDLRG